MQAGKKKRRRRGLVLVLGLVLATATSAGLWSRLSGRSRPAEGYQLTDVRRTDLFPTVTASGRVESGKRTVIECEVQNVAVGVQGQRLYSGYSAVLLSVLPEGSLVKKGDILAVIDSSNYDELLRVQRIAVERARADLMQADLDHQIAQMAIEEYRGGVMKEALEDMEGKILLSRSEHERAVERLGWARRMKEKGYVPASLVTSELFRENQLAVDLTRQQSALNLYKRFTAPKLILQLEGAVKGALVTLEYQKMRCQRHLDRLKLLEDQVALCTIRAPHDGFLIHANNSDRQIFIEEGMVVRQHQTLFYLPDLDDMEVVASLHESIVDRVRPEMRAHVQIEALKNRVVEGHVTSIAPIALLNWRSDVRNFEGIIKLSNPPRGLRPGMTASVEISMPRRENVLAVPTEAVANDDGHDFCFVVSEDGLERREITLGETTQDMAEVTSGLKEGEQVVLNPPDEMPGDDSSADVPRSPVAARFEPAPSRDKLAATR